MTPGRTPPGIDVDDRIVGSHEPLVRAGCHGVVERNVPGRAPLAVLYIHGFNGAPGEVAPQAARIARALGANFVAPLLPGHGLPDDAQLRGITLRDWIGAVERAYERALALGERVVVIGGSLGGALAIDLASRRDVAAVIAWSPGVRVEQRALLDRFADAGDAFITEWRAPGVELTPWNAAAIHADGFRALRELYDTRMVPATFARVTAPFWLGYYWRDEANQDPITSVAAMREMFAALGTPAAAKVEHAFPNGAHNLAAPAKSPAAEDVVQASIAFLRGQLRPVSTST